jgi:hypothetical protein
MPRLSKIGAAALGAFGWTSGSSISASYLVVAGGAGGSNGGGGAGGYLTGTASLNPTLSYTVTVGAGGAGGQADTTNGTNGSSSVFNAITSAGGGGGGNGASGGLGSAGGSGGGGGGWSSSSTGGAGNTPSTSPSQGNNGGTGAASGAAGGGGANATTGVGSNGAANTGGAGGAGTASSISGASVTYAGGGGGRGFTTAGAGGAGGGGAGTTGSGTGSAGTANLGGGGGGSGATNAGGQGGSGVVIISYVGAQQFGGGVVTSSGGNTIHTFQTSGTLSPLNSLSASYLIVAGGAGGGSNGNSGGGGAGGLLTGSGTTIDTNSTYVVTVGAGGAINTNGVNSAFSVVSTTAIGGGAGANSAANGSNGGSGGGGSGGGAGATTGGTGTSGQGNAGGSAPIATGPAFGAGGGGGSSAVGANGTGSTGGNGGAGTEYPVSSGTYYAGGGGGGSNTGLGSGGTGGGGAGSVLSVSFSVAGTANTGGGGGGGTSSSYASGAAGGSGVVIISYAGATQLMAGGTVTISGGNVIHTFTSSGYLTPLKLVNNSLRFRASAAAYLNRTFGTPTNNRVWTWSAWVKRGSLSLAQANHLFMGTPTDVTANPTTYGRLVFETDGTLRYQSAASSVATESFTSSAVYRDPAAWYHIVLYMDAVNTTVRGYVNGTEITYASRTQPTNTNTAINGAGNFHRMGFFRNAELRPFDGYMTEINFIDGQALTPNSFGTFNSYGVWQPITYGGSYGNNGFYLPFTNKTSTTTLGYDFSPNGNNWTPNNLSLTAGATYDSMTDVPTLTSANTANYCVLNPLSALNSSTTADGNLKGTLPAATALTDIYGTMASGTTDKFYWETTYVSRSGNSALTIGGVRSDVFGAEPSGTGGFGYYSVGGQVFVNGSTVATYATYATSDVIGVALDLTNSQVSFYKQTSGAGSFVLQGTVSIASGYSWIPGYSNGTTSGNQVFTVNFGQQPFNNSSPPSGYVALNTYNI